MRAPGALTRFSDKSPENTLTIFFMSESSLEGGVVAQELLKVGFGGIHRIGQSQVGPEAG